MVAALASRLKPIGQKEDTLINSPPPIQRAEIPNCSDSPLKECFLKCAMRLSGIYLRNRLLPWGKQAYWKRVCVPHLCWRDTEVTVRTWFGQRMSVRPSDFVENRICFFGKWEPAVTEIFCQLKPGDVVVDVGANVGYYTLLAAKLVGPSGHVYAVEASASTRSRMQRNLSLNRVSNVTVLPVAAWDSAGETVFYHTRHNQGGATLRHSEDAMYTETVELSRLDDLIDSKRAPNIALIKMDIEGAECHALRGLMGTLENAPRAQIVSEVNPTMLMQLGGSATELFALLEAFQLQPSQINECFNTLTDAEPYLYPRPTVPPIPMSGVPSDPTDVLFTRNFAQP